MTNPHSRPIHVTRWRNFRALIGTEKGAVTEAARRLDKLQGQVSHFGGARPIKNIGDDLAAQIERAWQLPAGALDLNNSAESNPPAGGDVPTGTRFAKEDAAILAQAEKWVRFEERARRARYATLPRFTRLLEIAHTIHADGGTLSPEHADALITTARQVIAAHATPQAPAKPSTG